MDFFAITDDEEERPLSNVSVMDEEIHQNITASFRNCYRNEADVNYNLTYQSHEYVLSEITRPAY